MNKLKYHTIVLEGIDKCGKDTLVKYLNVLGNYKYIINSRGIISMIAYSKLYNRDYQYDVEPSNDVYILLEVKYEDWIVRCKSTNETQLDYSQNVAAFEYAIEKIQSISDNYVFVYDTSTLTPYEIAKLILNMMNNLNKCNEITTRGFK